MRILITILQRRGLHKRFQHYSLQGPKWVQLKAFVRRSWNSPLFPKYSAWSEFIINCIPVDGMNHSMPITREVFPHTLLDAKHLCLFEHSFTQVGIWMQSFASRKALIARPNRSESSSDFEIWVIHGSSAQISRGGDNWSTRGRYESQFPNLLFRFFREFLGKLDQSLRAKRLYSLTIVCLRACVNASMHSAF